MQMGGGISSVQVKGPNTGWTGLHNLYGAEWELDQQPQLPLDVHIVADTGAEVTATFAPTACLAVNFLVSATKAVLLMSLGTCTA